MGNKHSSSKSQTPNYGHRMASTHDISDLEFQEPPVTESSKKKKTEHHRVLEKDVKVAGCATGIRLD